MTELNARLVLDAVNEKIKKVSEFPDFKDWRVDKDLALCQLRDLRNELMLMIKVKEYYEGVKNETY